MRTDTHGFALWAPPPPRSALGRAFDHCLSLSTILICSVSSPPAGRKSLTYFNHDSRAALQEVTFDLQDAKKIFFGSFHKVLGTVCLSPDPLACPSLHVVVFCESQTLIYIEPLTLVLRCSDCPSLIWVREQTLFWGGGEGGGSFSSFL